MSQAPDRRYNDRDIEDDPYLVTWAEAYTAQYTGDYAPMVEACREFRQQHGLSPRTARIVMNIARNDSRVRDRLPVPAAPKEIVLPERDGSVLTPRPRAAQQPRRLPPPPVPRRKIRVELAATIHTPYIVGTSFATKFVHDARGDGLAVWELDGFVPGISPWGWMDMEGPTLRHLHAIQAYGQCGTLLKAPHFLTSDERHRDYAGRPLCSRCRAAS